MEGRRRRKRRQERQTKGEGEDIAIEKLGIAQYYMERVSAYLFQISGE